MIDKNEVRNLLVDGKTVKEISEKLGGTVGHIRRVVQENGWKNLKKRGDSDILDLLKKGYTVEEIIDITKYTEQWVYKVKKRYGFTIEEKDGKKLSDWCSEIFSDIKIMSKKYSRSIRKKSGVHISPDDIETKLIDLMIHTDKKDIENKTAYFRKYAPFIVTKLKTDIIKREPESLFIEAEDSDGISSEEKYSDLFDPENLLIIRERMEYEK